MNAILALRGVFSPSKTAKTLEWGRGGGGGEGRYRLHKTDHQ